MEQEKLNLKTARWLLDGARAFMENETLERWPDAQGLTREELFFVIRDITKVGSDEGAVEALGKIVDEDISTTVPPKLNELVQDLEQHEETTQQSDEAVEEKIRKLRAFINDQRYHEQRATESNIYVAPKEETQQTTQQVPSAEEPTTTPAQIPQTPQVTPPSEPAVDNQFTYRRPLPPRPAAAPPSPKVTEGSTKPSVVERIAGQIPPTETRIEPSTASIAPTRPATPGYVTPTAEPIRQSQGEQATKAIFVVKKSFARPLLARLSGAPTHALRAVIAVGTEAVGHGPDATQKAYASKLLNQGVTSISFRQAINEYVKGTTGEKGVIDALMKQADVLEQYEADHPYLARVTKSLYPAKYNQLVLANRPVAPEKGVSVENYKITINPINQQIDSVDYVNPSEITRATEATQTQAIHRIDGDLPEVFREGVASAGTNGLSRISIFLKQLPLSIAQLLKVGSGPGEIVLTRSLQVSFAVAGSAARDFSRFFSNGKVGGIFGPMPSISKEISWVVLLLVILAPATIMLLTGFAINTKQKAYLGAEVEQSLFIDVTKITPQTSFANEGELPDNISYTITVRPKQGKLTNVIINDQYTVSGEGNATIPSRSWTVPEIATEWKQAYTEDIASKKSGLRNSLLINIVTVSADIEGQPKQTKSTSAVIVIGNPPQDCPAGWPTPAGGRISQGPETHGPNATHDEPGQTEAIDIDDNIGTPVVATHRGTAYLYDDRFGGKDIEVIGTCNGRQFKSWYVHLSTRSITNGQQVTRGTAIGAIGQTGFANHPHLHYMFTEGLRMEPPYVPQSPRGCIGSCGKVE